MTQAHNQIGQTNSIQIWQDRPVLPGAVECNALVQHERVRSELEQRRRHRQQIACPTSNVGELNEAQSSTTEHELTREVDPAMQRAVGRRMDAMVVACIAPHNEMRMSTLKRRNSANGH